MHKRKINVLFLLPSLRYTGAGRQVVDLVNGLSSEKINVHLLTFEKQLDQLDRLDTKKVTFYNYPRRFKFDASVITRISRLIEKEDIDIVHCTNQIALLFGFLGKISARRKPKLVVALHTTVNRSIKNELFDWFLYAPIMMFCDAIIAVCQNQRVYWSKKYPWLSSRFVTVHNGIDTDQYAEILSPEEKKELRRSLGIDETDVSVAVVAELRVEKGHEYAFRAVRTLLDRGCKCILLLVGDGDRLSNLRSLAQRLSLHENIRWLGYQKDPRPYLSIADLFLLPSYAVETFSLALLEALSMGKPAIATDIGGSSEIVIEGVNGFLVKSKDVRSLAEKLGRLINDRELREKFGAKARESIVHKFNLSNMISKTEGLLIELASADDLEIRSDRTNKENDLH